MTALNLMQSDLETQIESLWEERGDISSSTPGAKIQPILEAVAFLDQGLLRTAVPHGNHWDVQEWVKKAVLLYFRIQDNVIAQDGLHTSFDKIPLKFTSWSAQDFKALGLRVVPGAVVRYGAYVGEKVIVMPSFINIGAYVGAGTMVDSYVTIGSCAQIGSNCHISANVLIGGVLEPLQAEPVIIEDDCFIGAGSQVVEGVRIGKGSVLGMGVNLGASTPILDRATGKITYGVVPEYSVVIPGSMPSDKGDVPVNLPCAVIVKTVNEQTRSKTSLNDLLRP